MVTETQKKEYCRESGPSTRVLTLERGTHSASPWWSNRERYRKLNILTLLSLISLLSYNTLHWTTLNWNPEGTGTTDVVDEDQTLGSQHRGEKGGKGIWGSKYKLHSTSHPFSPWHPLLPFFLWVKSSHLQYRELTKVHLPLYHYRVMSVQAPYWSLKFSHHQCSSYNVVEDEEKGKNWHKT